MESQPQNPEFRNNPENFHPNDQLDYWNINIASLVNLLSREQITKVLIRLRVWSLFVCFVALRPKSTAMVIAGRSVHLTTLFPGQA